MAQEQKKERDPIINKEALKERARDTRQEMKEGAQEFGADVKAGAVATGAAVKKAAVATKDGVQTAAMKTEKWTAEKMGNASNKMEQHVNKAEAKKKDCDK